MAGKPISILINDPYRTPYETWDAWDAQQMPLMEGKIKDIVVLDGGQMYAALELAVSGTGGNVDTIPVFDEFGTLTDIILMTLICLMWIVITSLARWELVRAFRKALVLGWPQSKC